MDDNARQIIAALVAALRHVRTCLSCSQEPWEDCEGGRAALAAIQKAEEPHD